MKARVKGPQWWTASSAATQHARGAGRPANKDASRSCLHRPSVSSDSQHQSQSERARVGVGSTASDRRGAAGSAPACARHAAAATARSATGSSEDLMVGSVWVWYSLQVAQGFIYRLRSLVR